MTMTKDPGNDLPAKLNEPAPLDPAATKKDEPAPVSPPKPDYENSLHALLTKPGADTPKPH